MAKELPYFKFETSEWENGTIQMCDRETKGLFIDLCSMYWARLGDVKTKLAMQKLCNGNASALQVLIKEDIIQIENEQIRIVFLDEQLTEFNEVSNKRKKAADKRWKNSPDTEAINASAYASALQVECKSNAIREEKRREEKIYIDFDLLMKFYNETFGRAIRVIPAKAKKQIADRMKEGYTKEDLKQVLLNAKSDSYHIETKYKYISLEFVTRSDKFERFSQNHLLALPKPKKV